MFLIEKGCIIAFTSEFIPRLLYRYADHRINSNDYGSLTGYVDFTLTQRNIFHSGQNVTC